MEKIFEHHRWELTKEVKEKYTPIIKDIIDNIEKNDSEELYENNLSGTELNPFTLGLILESLEYERDYSDDNGWELDFWIHYKKEGYKPIRIEGTGIIFELYLVEDD